MGIFCIKKWWPDLGPGVGQEVGPRSLLRRKKMEYFLNSNLFEDLVTHKGSEFKLDPQRHRMAPKENNMLFYLRPLQVWPQIIESGLTVYVVRARRTNKPYGAADGLVPIPCWIEVVLQE